MISGLDLIAGDSITSAHNHIFSRNSIPAWWWSVKVLEVDWTICYIFEPDKVSAKALLSLI